MSMHDLELPLQLQKKLDRLTTALKDYGRLAIAFSGGVDSALLLAAAVGAVGRGQVFAVTVLSDFFTGRELERAKQAAARLSVEHLCLGMDILSLPEVVQNDRRRCYYCKRQSFSMVKEAAMEKGCHVLAHGINTDDLGDYRPGIKAADELGFKAPLVAAGFSKVDVRACARAMGLEVWDLPSQSCLATRIPPGEKITTERLTMVEQAEDVLHDMGAGQVRVRCHGRLARIEVPLENFHWFLAEGLRQKVVDRLVRIGFSFVTIDLGGYETGKMNRV